MTDTENVNTLRWREWQRRKRQGLVLFQLEARPEDVHNLLVQEGAAVDGRTLDHDILQARFNSLILDKLRA